MLLLIQEFRYLQDEPPNFYEEPSNFALEASFMAVSKPIFASKYAFSSRFRVLQDSHTFAPFQIQKFSKISSKKIPFFKILHFSANFIIFRTNFDGFVSEIHAFSLKTVEISGYFKKCRE